MCGKRSLFLAAIGLLPLFAFVDRVYCQGWREDPKLSTPISLATGWVDLSTSSGNRYNVYTSIPDQGGFIITWSDSRDGNRDIYAQKMDRFGFPVWEPNGVAICSAPNSQSKPTLISDTNGGAIITWIDKRTGGRHEVYAQRIDRHGNPL